MQKIFKEKPTLLSSKLIWDASSFSDLKDKVKRLD